jgi:signal transduction histidine kinase/HAMP domain-containing protein
MLDFWKNSLTAKLNIKVIIAFLLVAAIVTLMHTYQTKEMLTRVAKNSAATSLDLLSNRINEQLDLISNTAKISGDNIRNIVGNENLNYDEDNVKIFLSNFSSSVKAFTIALEPGIELDKNYKNGVVRYVSNESLVINEPLNLDSFDYTQMDWYADAKLKEYPFWSEPYISNIIPNAPFVTTYSYPLFIYNSENSEEIFVGVLAISVDISFFENFLNSIYIGDESYNILVSKDGNFAVHPVKKFVSTSIFQDREKSDVSSQSHNSVKKLMKNDTNFIKIDTLGNFATNNSFIISKEILANNWKILSVFPNDILGNGYIKLINSIAVIAAFGIISFIFIIVFTLNNTLNSLRKLGQSMSVINTYDITDWDLPKIDTKDEIENLSKSFNYIVDELRTKENVLRDTNVNLTNLKRTQEEFAYKLEKTIEERIVDLNSKNQLLEMTLNNIGSLNELGKIITGTLSLDEICASIYEKLRSLIPVDIFTIMLYNKKDNTLACENGVIMGRKVNPFKISIYDKAFIAVKCFDSRQSITINNLDLEYQNYVLMKPSSFFEKDPSSFFYCPLVDGDNILGLFTIQSYNKNVFKDFNFDVLTSLRTYLNISLKNVLSYLNLQDSISDLHLTQDKLVQSERMASLGQLTAGIAHEIKNPLNFVINFSELSNSLVKDLQDEINAIKKDISQSVEEEKIQEIDDLLEDLELNVGKINEHSKRADNIVRDMLQHTRGNYGEFSPTDVNSLISEYGKLAYHGLRATNPEFNVKINYSFDVTIQKVNLSPHNISRVIVNIVTNGCYAAYEKFRRGDNPDFAPEVNIKTLNSQDFIYIVIRDNGIGISEENMSKILIPFFTTKSAGQGTGLGLSICYDIIVEEHKGEILIDSKENEFAEFKIIIPKNL